MYMYMYIYAHVLQHKSEGQQKVFYPPLHESQGLSSGQCAEIHV